MELPLPNSYWVIPGRFLAGEHPYGLSGADTRRRIESLSRAGVDYFYDLTSLGELPEYRRWLPRPAKYSRSAIVDMEVPQAPSQMHEIQTRIRAALMFDRGVYVHCRAGIGRTGTVVGCFLVEPGLDGNAALKQLNLLWRQSARAHDWPEIPQTTAQADYIRAWAAGQRPKGRAPKQDPRHARHRA